MLRDDALPGPERLADLAAEFEADTGVPCQVAVTGDRERDLGTDGAADLVPGRAGGPHQHPQARPRRAGSRSASAYEPSGTRLTIEDFGRCGERPAPDDGTGYGLTGMRERAELLGGTLTAGPTDGGFRVDLRVPA